MAWYVASHGQKGLGQLENSLSSSSKIECFQFFLFLWNVTEKMATKIVKLFLDCYLRNFLKERFTYKELTIRKS